MTEPVTEDPTPRRRDVSTWVGWVLAIPATGLIVFVLIGIFSRPDLSAQETANAIGRVLGAIAGGLIGWWIVRRVFKYQFRGRFLSPWIIVIAAVVLILAAVGRVSQLPADRSIADYLRPADGYSYPRDTEDQAAFEDALATASLSESELAERGLFWADKDSQHVALVQVVGIEPAYIGTRQDDFWSDFAAGFTSTAAAVKGDVLLGQAISRVTSPDGTVGVFWHVDNLSIYVIGTDQDTVTAVARSLLRANGANAD